MEKQTQDLLAILKELNVNLIADTAGLNTVINIPDLKRNINNISSKKDTVIFFDTQSYNSNTFTDNVIKFIRDFKDITFKDFSVMFSLDNNNITQESNFFNSFKEKVIKQLSETEVYYCNDLEAFQTIFANFYDDKSQVKPTILSFKYNEKETSSFIDIETLNALNVRNISKIFLNLANLK